MGQALKRQYQEKLGDDFGTVLYEIRNDWLTGLVRLTSVGQKTPFSGRDLR